MASTVGSTSTDPKEQPCMQPLGYVEVLYRVRWGTLKYISEFFCFAVLMEIFSLTTWRPVLSAICGDGKGLKELDTFIIKPLTFS